ncbi:hypothetical protein PS15m_008893 [Mucor circinelloides]
MGQSRKGKSKETLKIRPYRPRRQTQTPKNETKATPEPAQSEQPAPASAPSTSRSAPQREDFPESNATPTISIEDDQADTNASHDKNKSSNDDEDDGNKKNRGSWTPEKQIVLLQKYAEHFPPGAPWGKSTEAWQKIVDSVNAVAPNDTPLRYDACRRAVDRISERYIEEASIKKAAIEALAKRNKHEGEKADKLIQQESKKERKRMKRLIIQRLANERLVGDPTEEANSSSSSSNNNSSSIAPPLPRQPQYDGSIAPPVINYIQFDQAYVEEQRHYQRLVLDYLQSMNETLKDLSEKLKK